MKHITKALDTFSVDYWYFDDPIYLRYLTGLSVSKGMILWGKKQGFWVDGRYFSHVEKYSPIQTYLLTQEGFFSFLPNKKIRVGFDPSKMDVKSLEEKKKKYPKIDWIAAEKAFSSFRLIKTDKEIKKMQEAAKISYAGYLHLLQKIKTGVSEKELAWEYEKFCRENGAEKLAFDPIVAFGENSAIPHWKSSSKKLKKNEIVLLDLGIVFEGYCSDFTRTHFYGKISSEIQKLYQLVNQAKILAASKAKPGQKVRELEKKVRKVFSENKVENLFVHSLGHGIGLEVHEPLTVSQKNKNGILEKNMLITIEPGLYLEGAGGIRLEDTYLITSTGAKSLYPKILAPELL